MRKIAMIGNAHLDPAWIWKWQEGSAEVKATIRSALDRMKENKDYIFVFSQAQSYMWLKDFDEEMFKEVKKRVKEGRFIIVGGWNVQPDCNLPSGETYARLSLYSQRFFKKEFGITAKCGYCVDSFGHNSSIPKILKESGMDYYVFMRPMEYEKHMDDNIFKWVADDGSSVLAFRIQNAYCINFEDYETLSKYVDGEISSNRFKDDFMIFYGIGNHGGGPSKQNLKLIGEYKEKNKDKVDMYFSEPTAFLSEYEKSHKSIPEYRGELQHHAAGAYSTTSEVKKLLRTAETTALEAEKLCFLVSKVLGKNYDVADFEDVWNKIGFCTFHDITAGCCIKSAMDEAVYQLSYAIAKAKELKNSAMQTLSWKVDTINAIGMPIVVFNPTTVDFKGLVKVNTSATEVLDVNGKTVPMQKTVSEAQSQSGRPDTTFYAEVPAMGYSVYFSEDKGVLHYTYERTQAYNPPKPISYLLEQGLNSTLKITKKSIENEKVKITFDSFGEIKTYIDKKTGLNLIGKDGVKSLVLDESDHDTWSHDKNTFDKVIGRFKKAKFTVLENGPLRATIKVESKYKESFLTRYYSLEKDSDFVKIRCRLKWFEKHKMLKFAFDTSLTETESFAETQFSTTSRPANGEEQPGLRYYAIKGKEGVLAAFNDSKYSYSLKDSTLLLTAIRSPIYGDHGHVRNIESIYTDQGVFEFNYELKFYDKLDLSSMHDTAEIFNANIEGYIENRHVGSLPYTLKGITVKNKNVKVTAVKKAEDGKGDIIRIFEVEGKKTTAKISVYGLNDISVELKPHQIKTLRILDSGEFKEVLFTEFDK